MKRALLAAAASLVLALPIGAATAQNAAVSADAAGNAHAMTDAQKDMYDAWPVERRTAYDAWPNTYKAYFWTLTPEQQTGWWALTDEQRSKVYAMTPEQRTATWASIASQLGAAATPADTASTANMAAHAGMAASGASADAGMTSSTTAAGNMQFVRRETAQPVAAAHDAAAVASGDLPVCKKGQQDGCINGWEKNKSGNKPLSYWPGKPASEIPGKKPEPQADPK